MSQMSLSTTGYSKAKKAKTRTKARHNVLSKEQKSGTALKWRMSKKQDKKITKAVVKNIEAAHLYPALKIEKVADGKLHFKHGLGSERATELKEFVVIGNGDGNETASWITLQCDSKHLTADLPPDCKLSSAKLRGAYLYFGPKPIDPDLASALMNAVSTFPKSKQAIQLLPDTFARLQK